MARKPAAKPRKQKLKLFRTPIGFHDAYVAAPSRKAALEAWGATTDLFSAEIAEQVTDPEMMKEALARPGEIIRRKRGSGDIEPTSPATRKSSAARSMARRPSRAALDRAEAALRALEEKQAKERVAFEREEQALEKRRQSMESKQARALEKATARRDEAEDRYRGALSRWEA